MDLAVRWHRLLRALVGIVCFALGLGVAVFIFSNLAPTEIHWRIPANIGYSYDLTFRGVSLWVLAVVPLLVGAVVGYLYQTPARMHHVREAMRHGHRVHELEHELKELRADLDKVLAMPEEGNLAMPASLLPALERHLAEPADDPERDPRLLDEPEAFEVLAATPVKDRVKALAAVPAAPKAARPRRRALVGLKAEVSEIKLPAAIPATIVVPTRRERTANGKSKAVPMPAARPPVKPGRKAVVKKPR